MVPILHAIELPKDLTISVLEEEVLYLNTFELSKFSKVFSFDFIEFCLTKLFNIQYLLHLAHNGSKMCYQTISVHPLCITRFPTVPRAHNRDVLVWGISMRQTKQTKQTNKPSFLIIDRLLFLENGAFRTSSLTFLDEQRLWN
jgi:hypothetical protein